MADLVSGRYPQTDPFYSLLGQTANQNQSDVPVRSNLRWFGLGNPTDGALAGTGVACSVPVPVDPGDVISEVSILVGATAASVPTHQWAALYSGTSTPSKLASSADGTSASVAASAAYGFSLASPYEVRGQDAPYGFVYATVSFTATTVPSALVVATPTGINYQWTTNGPLFLSATHGTSLAGSVPATIASPAAKAVAPIVLLT